MIRIADNSEFREPTLDVHAPIELSADDSIVKQMKEERKGGWNRAEAERHIDEYLWHIRRIAEDAVYCIYSAQGYAYASFYTDRSEEIQLIEKARKAVQVRVIDDFIARERAKMLFAFDFHDYANPPHAKTHPECIIIEERQDDNRNVLTFVKREKSKSRRKKDGR